MNTLLNCEAVGSADWRWKLADHVCRKCLSRLVEAPDRLFMCPTCEAQAQNTPHTICGCGIRVGESKRDGGFHCVPNPDRSPRNPSAVVIAFGGELNLMPQRQEPPAT